MKRMIRFSILVFLATIAGCKGETLPAISNASLQAQAPTVAEALTVPLVIPTKANINLTDRSPLIAQVVAIDAQRQELGLRGSDGNVTVPLNRVEQLVSRKDAPVYVGGQPVIRGETPEGAEYTWNEPISALKINDPIKGQAEVRLRNINPRERKSIQQVIRGNGRIPGGFVVEAIKFDLSKGTMTIEVRPY
ncbi:hypothetical protein QQ056_16810 [Oscillatoria laete-virens NRMC-F 0139]|nr:hypothetical protein [Oscillatoria laete-virens]MDL5055194.1 hypothetical protein [Oscillatoria laete-virens NRMC-F 0139]